MQENQPSTPQVNPVPPSKLGLQPFSIRLAKIFSNIAIIFLVLCICGMLSFVASALIFLFGAIATIITMGTIFSFAPNFWDQIFSLINASANLSATLLSNFYIFFALSVVLAIASIILLALDKQVKHTGRIVVNSIVLFVMFICLVIILAWGF